MAQEHDSPFIWTDTERLSGHSMIVFAPWPDEGPWSRTAVGTEQGAWVAVGLRADSGLIDVLHVQGPRPSVGMITPQQGGVVPQEMAVAIGEASGASADLDERVSVFEKAGALLRNRITRDQADTSAYNVRVVATSGERKEALSLLGDREAAAMADAMRAHPKIAPFHLEGNQVTKDPRVPGTIEALNVLNGAIPWGFGDRNSQVHSDEVRDKWVAMARENPALPAAMGAIAAQRPLPPHLNSDAHGPTNLHETAIALGGAIVHAEGEAASVRRAWMEGAIMSPSTLDRTRSEMIAALPTLVKHGRETPEAITAFCATAHTQLYPSDLDALGEGMAFARGLDNLARSVNHPTQGRADLLAKTSLHTATRATHMLHGARLDKALADLSGIVIPQAVAAAERVYPDLAGRKDWQESKLPNAIHTRAAEILLGNDRTVSMPRLAEQTKAIAASGAAWSIEAFGKERGQPEAAASLAAALDTTPAYLGSTLLPKAAVAITAQKAQPASQMSPSGDAR